MNLPPVASPDDPVRWTLITARGADARSFLQGQLSADVRSVSPDHCRSSLLLSPGGEVITSLECRGVPGDVDAIDVVVREEMAEVAASALRRFLMRTRCELTVAGQVDGPYATLGEQVDAGEPGPNEFAQALSAHSFGRSFVSRRVSFTKGCFTGQELVGRLDARDAPVPFRLARVSGHDIARMNDVVTSAGPKGERARQGLTTVVGERRLRGLAVVHRTLGMGTTLLDATDVSIELLHEPSDADN